MTSHVETDRIDFRPLARTVRGAVLNDDVTRAIYANAACIYEIRPLAVVVPECDEDVSETVAFARKHSVPIIARGAGSGLAGQAIGAGIILDLSVRMNRIVEVAPDFVRVQPGVVCDALNRKLEAYGLWFPPDPSSSGYCSIGGMIANNSSGAHSVKYGSTIDYIETLRVVVGTGEQLVLGNTAGLPTHGLAEELRRIVEANADLIRRSTPRTAKNSSGYRLDALLDDFNPAKVFAASEGTLGIILEAKLRVIPVPPAKKLLILSLPGVAEAAEATQRLLELRPSACEILDPRTLEILRSQRADLASLISPSANTVLHVEFDGTAQEVEQAAAKLRELLHGVEVEEPPEPQRHWAMRRSILPILYKRPGRRRVTTFIEDVAVPTDKLAEYVAGLYRILDRYQLQATAAGHAGQANFHTRPFLDLRDPGDVELMRTVADEVYELVWKLGGTVSGEHGDGLSRSAFVRRQYGKLYEVFRQVKRVFDPANILNPGRIVEPTNSLTDNLRYGPDYRRDQERPELLFEDYATEVEKCHGCGACRTPLASTSMCPIFKTLGIEAASPRAKANLLRQLLSGRLRRNRRNRERIRFLANLCISCKMCVVECPSGVNIPKLILDLRAKEAAANGLTLTETLLSAPARWAKLAALTPRLATRLSRTALARLAAEKLAGLDRRRPLPPFSRGLSTAERSDARPTSLQARSPIPNLDSQIRSRRVVYFPDLYATYHNPELARTVVHVLEAYGCEPVIPAGLDSGLPALDYGNLRLFRATVERNLAALEPFVKERLPIIFSEPSACLCVKHDYAWVSDSPLVKETADLCKDLFQFLLEFRDQEGGGCPRTTPALKPLGMKLGYHAPCHLKVLRIGRPSLTILRQIPGLEIRELASTCCGIAGTFGFRKGLSKATGASEEGSAISPYEVSMRIGEKLFEELRRPEFEAGLTECSTCKLQMEHGSGKPVYHPAEILAMAIAPADAPPPCAGG